MPAAHREAELGTTNARRERLEADLCGRSANRALADERGAVAVIGLFMAVFLTAAAYYVVGIGEAVLFRERMQDAADTAAFSAAVLHARGMNLIALVNMTMAALLAILVALKLVQAVVLVAMAVIAGLGFFNPGALQFLPPLSRTSARIQQLHARLQPHIHRMIETLHVANGAIRTAVPAASVLRGAWIATAYDSSPAKVALVLPASGTLPVEDGTFDMLCEQAATYVGGLTTFALEQIVPSGIADAVGGATSQLTSAGSDWFCGPTRASPPSATVEVKTQHPKLPSAEACEQVDATQPDYSPERHQRLCDQADRDRAASNPDRETGQCSGACDPELYALRAERARSACAPRRGGNAWSEFEWQQRTVRRTYRVVDSEWQLVSEEVTDPPRLERANRRPCGDDGARIGPEWHLETRDAEGRPVPLCSRQREVPELGVPAQRVVVERVEVLQLFGCVESEVREVGPVADPGVRPADGADGSADKRVPQVLREGVLLGDDELQIRSGVVGHAPPSLAQRVIELARWRRRPSTTQAALEGTGEVGRLAFAQAEYFFAVEDGGAYDPASLLWNMRWTARLRRFRLPEPDPANAGAGTSASEAVTGGITELCSNSMDRADDTPVNPCELLPDLFDAVAH